VQIGAGVLFAIGAIILARGARRADLEERQQEQEYQSKVREPKKGWRAFVASFLVLFTAEWGDLSQLVIAGLVASGRDPIATGAGGLLALAAVSGLAVLLGRWLLQRVRLSIIRWTGAGVCAVLSLVTLISAA
jgi:putative Ca2+/H+ antiporter (TMEM165/GDT1 family)